jgi:hypothetical protein
MRTLGILRFEGGVFAAGFSAVVMIPIQRFSAAPSCAVGVQVVQG